MPSVKVNRHSSPMKIVVQNLCKLIIFPNNNLAVCFHEKRNLEFSRKEKRQNSFQKNKSLYSNLYSFTDSIYIFFNGSQTHVQNEQRRFLRSECSFYSRIQCATSQLRFGKINVKFQPEFYNTLKFFL